MFEIEKGIPLPTEGRGRAKSELRLAIEKMEVGDSMIIPTDLRNRVPNIMHRLCFNYTARLVKDDKTKVRVWRVK